MVIATAAVFTTVNKIAVPIAICRIENLICVVQAPELPDQDDRKMLTFETLTWVPIDRRLIDLEALSPTERAWIDTYHDGVAQRMSGRLSPEVAAWLGEATKPL